MKRWFVVPAPALLLGLSYGCAAPGETTNAADRSARSPVVVLITAANLRADVVDLDDPRGLTPRLAEHAKRAAWAGSAIAASSVELPALASLVSGVLPSHHGVWAWELDEVGPRAPWLSAELAAAGVVTEAWVGRPAIGPHNGWSRGFATWRQLARLRTVRSALTEPTPGPHFTWIDLAGARPPWLLAEFPVPIEVPPHALPKRLSPGELLGLVRGRNGLRSDSRGVAAALYRHAVARTDSELGQLLDAVQESPRAHESWVFVTSDCGFRLGEDGRVGCGHGLDPVDLEVPLLVFAPVRSCITTELEQPSLLRIVPTVGAAFGLEPLPGWEAGLCQSSPRAAASEVPASRGWRAASVIRDGVQLLRLELWGEAGTDALHPDSLGEHQAERLLASRPWISAGFERRSWPPGSPLPATGHDRETPRDSLELELDAISSPGAERLSDQRRLAGSPRRGILPDAP